MTGSALMDFLITCVGLSLIAWMVFQAIDYIAPDATSKQIGRYAVGGVALLTFLWAVKAVLFGGPGAAISPVNLIDFAIALIVLLIVVFIINIVVGKLAPADWVVPIKYVLGAVALIALLVIAGQALFGGGLGIAHNFRLR